MSGARGTHLCMMCMMCIHVGGCDRVWVERAEVCSARGLVFSPSDRMCTCLHA
jgi:hypothetical protein